MPVVRWMGHPVVPVPDSVERALSPTFQQPIGGRQKAKASPSCAVLALRATFQRSRGIIYKKAGPFFSGTRGSSCTCPPCLPFGRPIPLRSIRSGLSVLPSHALARAPPCSRNHNSCLPFDHSLEIEVTVDAFLIEVGVVLDSASLRCAASDVRCAPSPTAWDPAPHHNSTWPGTDHLALLTLHSIETIGEGVGLQQKHLSLRLLTS